MERGDDIEVREVPLETILQMRDEYRRAMNCQIVHDSWHRRGFTRSHLLLASGRVAGYGSVGGAPGEPSDTIKEFFVLPPERPRAEHFFRALVEASGARWVEAQTNDPFLHPMLLAFGADPSSDKVLFAEGGRTAHELPGATFRPLAERERDTVFAHTHEPVGEWCIEQAGEVIATGGFTLHYNPPYADIYMEVAPRHRRRGVGRFLVQQLVRACREAGHVAAARCSDTNAASQATLAAAGMVSCGRLVRARLREAAD